MSIILKHESMFKQREINFLISNIEVEKYLKAEKTLLIIKEQKNIIIIIINYFEAEVLIYQLRSP